MFLRLCKTANFFGGVVVGVGGSFYVEGVDYVGCRSNDKDGI